MRIGRSGEAVLALSLVAAGTGCTFARTVGQVELFEVQEDLTLRRFHGESEAKMVEAERTPETPPRWGDHIESNDDSVTIQVLSCYLHNLPGARSRDIVLFAEVQENAAEGYDAKPLTAVVFVGRNQLIPAKLNFNGNIAYGPTTFKGHPLKVKFSVVVLAKETDKNTASAIDILAGIAGPVVPGLSTMASQAASVARALLESNPDVITFDFEATFLAKAPKGLATTILKGAGSPVAELTAESGNGRRNGGDQKWDKRMAWLRYGVYALVETRSFGAGPYGLGWLGAKENKQTYGVPGKSNIQDLEGLSVEGGFIVFGRGKAGAGAPPPAETVAGGKGPEKAVENPVAADRALSERLLTSNYIVFAVTPGQLPEDEATLAAAASATTQLLDGLRKEQGNYDGAVQQIQGATDDMLLGVVKREWRGRVKAAMAASPFDRDEFERRVTADWETLKKKVRSDLLARAEVIREDVLVSFRKRFEDMDPVAMVAGRVRRKAENLQAKGSFPPPDAAMKPGFETAFDEFWEKTLKPKVPQDSVDAATAKVKDIRDEFAAKYK